MIQSGTHQSNIWKYYAFSALNNTLFFLPVVYIFWKSNGITYTEIYILEAIIAWVAVLFEVPTGAISDYFGKKFSILSGNICIIASCFVFALASASFLSYAVAYSLWAIGATLMSGSETALLYDILHSGKQHKAFKYYRGKSRVLNLVALSISGVIGGYIAASSFEWTFLGTAIAFILSFLILSSISHKEEVNKSKESYWSIVLSSINIVRKNQHLIWFTTFNACFGAFYKLLQVFVQPYMEYAGLSIEYFGLVGAYLFLLAAIGSHYAHRFENHTGKLSFPVLALLLIGSLIAISFFITEWTFLAFGIVYLGMSIQSIIIEHEILKLSPKSKHSTVLSFSNLVFLLVSSFTGLSFGHYLELQGIQDTIYWVLVAALAVMGILITWKSIISKK